MRKATTIGPHAENGRRIYDARRAKKLTQTVLGDHAGITYRQIIRLENGENLPSGEVRDAIAEALAIDPATLRSGDDGQEDALAGDPFRGADDASAAGDRKQRRRRAREAGELAA